MLPRGAFRVVCRKAHARLPTARPHCCTIPCVFPPRAILPPDDFAALRRACDDAPEIADPGKKATVWTDNEQFLEKPAKYKAAKREVCNFPTDSGDIGPMKTVWARLRKGVAKRGFEDLKQGKAITAAQFKKRASVPCQLPTRACLSQTGSSGS